MTQYQNIEVLSMKMSLQQYRRLGTRGYAEWLCKTNGIELQVFLDSIQQKELIIGLLDNHAINAHVANIIANSEKEEINKLVEVETENPFPEEIQKYDSLTVVELKEVCKERGLPVYGTKAELILRLKQNDEGIATDNEATDGPTEESVAPEEESEAPAEEAAASNGSELNGEEHSKQKPVIEE